MGSSVYPAPDRHMATSCTPTFTASDAARIAKATFGITATAVPLPSERDQNFALTTQDGRTCVLKVAKLDEERAILEFQNAALEHVARRETGLAVPRVLLARDGAAITSAKDTSGRSFWVRLVTWLEGDIWVHATPHRTPQLISLGTTLAKLDIAFQDFGHTAMHRELHWDLRHAGLALKHLRLLSESQQVVVRMFMSEWSSIEWQRLRQSVIHGDANDYNILVREGQVVGFLDFGDMVHSALVCDLAITLAYAMLDAHDPLQAGVTVTRSYAERLPLTESEIHALYPLVTARLCMSLCYAAYNAKVKSGDTYQQVTAGPAWGLLQRLSGVPLETARSVFHDSVAQSSILR